MSILARTISKFWKGLSPGTRTWIMRRLQRKFTASVVAVVTNERGEVLLLDHVLRPKSGWGMPGGFINLGEQPEAALRRELHEETGLDLGNVALLRVRTLKRHIEIVFTATGHGEAQVRSREITELGWYDPDSLPGDLSLDQQFLIRAVLRPEV